MYYRRNGKKISINRLITDDILFNDTIYPAPIHPTHFGVLGITEHPDPVFPDSRLRTWVYNPDGSGEIIVTDRDIAVVKREAKDRLRDRMNSFYIEKYNDIERDYLINDPNAPAAAKARLVADFRSLKTDYQANAASIDAATNLDAVLAAENSAVWTPID